MENREQVYKELGIIPKISFKDKEPHAFILKKWKVDKIQGMDGVEKQGVKFMVVEGGEVKTFFTTSLSLIQKLGYFAEGTLVTVQMQSKNVSGKVINVFVVSSGNTTTGGNSVDDGDIDDIDVGVKDLQVFTDNQMEEDYIPPGSGGSS